tara:strand:- start:153 stop:461 length:309 start_codon:yes stop_codon:yes gene_type:complete
MKITKRFLEKNIREVISEILKEGAEEAHNYEHTSLTGKEKDDFAIEVGLENIIRFIKQHEKTDPEYAKGILKNIESRLKQYADPIMKKRIDPKNWRTTKKEG